MTNLLGPNDPRRYKQLSPQTEANYRVRLRKLRKLRPFLTDPREIEMCEKELMKLCDKLGMEMEDPRLGLGPGRPSERLYLTPEKMALVPEELYEKSSAAKAEEVARSEQDLRRMEILARHGQTPEVIAERNRKLQEESLMNRKAQELQQAIDDAVVRQERLLERKCTDQERALIEMDVQDDYRKRAEEERLKEDEQKGNPTGS